MGAIVITGFMGCGKTRVARELARRLDAMMVDLDDEITKRTGRSPAQLIDEDGETAFRAIESETLREVLGAREAKVIALGGGAWIQEANRQLADQHSCTTIWLDTPFETCWARIKNLTKFAHSEGRVTRPLSSTNSAAPYINSRTFMFQFVKKMLKNWFSGSC